MQNRLLLFFVALFSQSFAGGQSLSPIDYGVLEAKNGFERYESLLRCHQIAVQTGAAVNYKGIDSLYLEIPHNAKSIPLPDNTDFCGVVLSVKNNTQDIYLFTKINQMQPISITAKEIDLGRINNNSTLSSGLYIVTVKDKKPWVPERLGYGVPHYRRDILLVKDGKAKNKVVMPYDNPQSEMECYYCKVTKNEKKINNLRFLRLPGSTHKTCLLKAVGENNIKVKNIIVETPEDSVLFADHVFMIEDCTNFTFEDVTVYGTYSQINKYGYAFCLNNVWNHKAIRVNASGKWGVYGNNNINTALLENCDLNRFDIHCYGKDITSINCRYTAYTCFSSVYGKVKFDKCMFIKARPVIFDWAYNAYTGFDVLFEKCIFYFDKRYHDFVDLISLDETLNERPELNRKCLPNIKIRNCEVYMEDGQDALYIYRTGNVGYKKDFDYLNSIDIKGLVIHTVNHNINLQLFTNEVRTAKRINVKERRVFVQDENDNKSSGSFLK